MPDSIKCHAVITFQSGQVITIDGLFACSIDAAINAIEVSETHPAASSGVKVTVKVIK